MHGPMNVRFITMLQTSMAVVASYVTDKSFLYPIFSNMPRNETSWSK